MNTVRWDATNQSVEVKVKGFFHSLSVTLGPNMNVAINPVGDRRWLCALWAYKRRMKWQWNVPFLIISLFSCKGVIMASLTLTLDTTDYGYIWFICIQNKHFSLFPLYAAAPVWHNDADFGLDGTLTDIFFNLPAWFLTVLTNINCWTFFWGGGGCSYLFLQWQFGGTTDPFILSHTRFEPGVTSPSPAQFDTGIHEDIVFILNAATGSFYQESRPTAGGSRRLILRTFKDWDAAAGGTACFHSTSAKTMKVLTLIIRHLWALHCYVLKGVSRCLSKPSPEPCVMFHICFACRLKHWALCTEVDTPHIQVHVFFYFFLCLGHQLCKPELLLLLF